MNTCSAAAQQCCCASTTANAPSFETEVTEVNGLLVTKLHRRSPVPATSTDAGSLRVQPLPVALGAYVSGVELEQVDWGSWCGRKLGERLRADLLRYGLLVFPGQGTLSPEQNLRLGHALSGGLTLYPRERGDRADGSHDDVIDGPGQHDVAQMSGLVYYYAGPALADAEPFFSPFPSDNNPSDNGTARATWPAHDSEGFEWHDDAAGHQDPRPLSMLFCLESPEVGGETLFLNGATAVAQLEPTMRTVAERLMVHYCQGEYDGHRIEHDGADGMQPPSAADSPWDPRVRQYARLASADLTHDLAEVTHSRMLVRNHPVTGASVFSTAASFVHHVEDTETGEHWSVKDSWRFISDCFVASLARPELVYAHHYVRDCA